MLVSYFSRLIHVFRSLLGFGPWGAFYAHFLELSHAGQPHRRRAENRNRNQAPRLRSLRRPQGFALRRALAAAAFRKHRLRRRLHHSAGLQGRPVATAGILRGAQPRCHAARIQARAGAHRGRCASAALPVVDTLPQGGGPRPRAASLGNRRRAERRDRRCRASSSSG